MNSVDWGHQAPLLLNGGFDEVMCTSQFDVLGSFFTASLSAAAQADAEVNWICEAVKVSGTVTSQARGLHVFRAEGLLRQVSSCHV